MVGYQGGKEVMNWETGMDICVCVCVTHTHSTDTIYEIDNYWEPTA